MYRTPVHVRVPVSTPRPVPIPRPIPVAAPASRGSGLAAAAPWGPLLCLALILFLAAATIVLALIPVYLPRKNISNLAQSRTQFIRATATPRVPALGTTAGAACVTIANSMNAAAGVPAGTVRPVTCIFAIQGSGRRRRSRLLSLRRRQSDDPKLFMEVIIDLAKCPACRQDKTVQKFIGLVFGATFDYFGVRSETFNIDNISSTGFGSLIFETPPGVPPGSVSSTSTSAPVVTSNSLIG